MHHNLNLRPINDTNAVYTGCSFIQISHDNNFDRVNVFQPRANLDYVMKTDLKPQSAGVKCWIPGMRLAMVCAFTCASLTR